MPLNLFKTTQVHQVPTEMNKILEVIMQSSCKEDALNIAYRLLIGKYHGSRVETYTKLYKVFSNDLETLWNSSGFMHCTNINYILKTLLIKSGKFEEEEIRFRWTFIWYISPHQYTQVLVNNCWVNIDIWSSVFGTQFGDYAHGFHT